MKTEQYGFECENPNCDCITVTKNFGGFLGNYSRITERLIDFIAKLAIEISCVGTTRIMSSMTEYKR